MPEAVGSVTGILDCGTFTVDSLRCSGSPRVMEISATSIPLASPIRRKKKTRAWEKTTLKAIAGVIAGENSLELLWDVEDDPGYPDQVKQDKASDLEFLLRLCKDAGSSICGAITGWWMMGMGASPYAIGAVCGVAGLLGDRGLQMLMEALAKKIGGINEKEQ